MASESNIFITYIETCENCGCDYIGDFCTDCYVECEGCGCITLIEDTTDGLCENCAD